MNIITGYKGTAHITAAQDGALNAGIFGNGNYITSEGTGLQAVVASNTSVQIKDGVLIMQGRAACIEAGAYDALTIAAATQGQTRYDLICAQYTKSSGGVESISLVVKKGGDHSFPSYTSGSIFDGDTTVEVPLYKVINAVGEGGSLTVEDISSSDGLSDYFIRSNSLGALSGVGTYLYNGLSSSLTVLNNQSTAVVGVALTTGVWILTARATWPSNATGFRQLCIGVNQDDIDQVSRMVYPANNGIITYTQTTRIVNVTTPATYWLNVRQSSGGSLTLGTGSQNSIYAVKIG